jgi:hypothetical protein
MCLKWLPLALLLATGARAADNDWINLFDGRSLDGWKASENPATFKVEDGTIVAHGPRAHLFYVGPAHGGTFRNFEFSAEVKAGAGANSGIYFHTAFQPTDWPKAGFEVQVNNSATRHGDYLELKKTGSLYGIRNVYTQLAADDEWFTMKIRVLGKNVQIRVNDLLVVDYNEPAEAPNKRLGAGTFALQGHDPGSRVAFRNLRVKPLPDTAPDPVPVQVDDFYRAVLKYSGANYPVVDFHTHLKGGLTLEEVLASGHETGFGHGIAVNCGLGFAVTNDAGIDAFLGDFPRAPVFKGMQAEGREWVKLFSPAARARFDYVFTDAMTITDEQGKRSRLWIKEEVEVRDKQAFMERLVQTIEQIMANEPIDIYVNPTFLPEVIAAEYDTLWTEARKQRVINAAAKNRIAIEISSRYQLPKADFIRAAKKAGIKFTLGTNNPGREILRNEYGLRMIQECGLTWQDMWTPLERKPR